MRIPCPHCGARDASEFLYLGDARLAERPVASGPTPEMEAYVYLRDNPAGPHAELWYHQSGCGAWLKVTRDTLTHAVLSAEAVR